MKAVFLGMGLLLGCSSHTEILTQDAGMSVDVGEDGGSADAEGSDARLEGFAGQGGGGGEEDAGQDASQDQDAGPDAQQDAGSDAGQDAGQDAGGLACETTIDCVDQIVCSGLGSAPCCHGTLKLCGCSGGGCNVP